MSPERVVGTGTWQYDPRVHTALLKVGPGSPSSITIVLTENTSAVTSSSATSRREVTTTTHPDLPLALAVLAIVGMVILAVTKGRIQDGPDAGASQATEGNSDASA